VPHRGKRNEPAWVAETAAALAAARGVAVHDMAARLSINFKALVGAA
jgi:TatD DNase family protein